MEGSRAFVPSQDSTEGCFNQAINVITPDIDLDMSCRVVTNNQATNMVFSATVFEFKNLIAGTARFTTDRTLEKNTIQSFDEAKGMTELYNGYIALEPGNTYWLWASWGLNDSNGYDAILYDTVTNSNISYKGLSSSAVDNGTWGSSNGTMALITPQNRMEVCVYRTGSGSDLSLVKGTDNSVAIIRVR